MFFYRGGICNGAPIAVNRLANYLSIMADTGHVEQSDSGAGVFCRHGMAVRTSLGRIETGDFKITAQMNDCRSAFGCEGCRASAHMDMVK